MHRLSSDSPRTDDSLSEVTKASSVPSSVLTEQTDGILSRSGPVLHHTTGSSTQNAGWSDSLEHRLRYVQAELKKSQRRWSEGQDLWLEEETYLLELKRRHIKALKADTATRKAAHTWKAKTFSKPKLLSLRSGYRKQSDVGSHSVSQSPARESRRHKSFSEGVTPFSSSEEEAVSDGEEDAREHGGGRLERTDPGSVVANTMRKLSFSVRARGSSASAKRLGLARAKSR